MKQKLAIAVDLGATNIRVALISQQGKILEKKTEQTKKEGRDGKVVTRQIENLIQEILEETPVGSILGIGIASIGPLDHKKGGPINSPNVPYPFIPLVKPLQKKFAIPVHFLNDTNAAALGEKYFSAGKNIDNLVYITISTGIGGGAIVDGNLLGGRGDNAAEVGHMIVDTTYNLQCTCQRGVGHWEGLASGTNIPRFFEIWAKQENIKCDFRAQEAKDVFEQARRENAAALKFIDELSRINARAISNIIVAYDPELITIGGSVALNNKDVILRGIKKYVDRYLALPQIQITRLGEDIPLLGAAVAVFERQK